MSLHKKIAEVMAAIDRIPKNGYNDFHRYHYATEADVSDTVRRELAEKGVALYVSSRIIGAREWQTPKGKATLLTDVEVDLTFADAESGETFQITAAGTGDDGSDKGTYKAITGAVKYALMKTFLIPTGDDPEADHQSGAAGRVAPITTAAAADGRGGPGHLPAHTPVDIGTAQIRGGPGSVVIPFGKYNGKTIAEIGVGDRKYVHYLSDKASRGDVKAAATAWLRETA